MLSFLQPAYGIALRRTVASWRLELVVLLGILLAVALLSSGAVFSDLLAEAAVRRALEGASPEQANLSMRVYTGQDSPRTAPEQLTVYRNAREFVQRRVVPRFQPYLRDQSRMLETATFYFEGHPQLELADSVRPRGQFRYMSGLLPQRIQVVEGRWPYGTATSEGAFSVSTPGQSGDSGTSTRPLEVALDVQGAELLQLGVGDRMAIFPAGGGPKPPSVDVEVVGVFRQTDPNDEFWYGVARAFSFKSEQWTLVPLFTAEAAILDRVILTYPGLSHDALWFFYLDRQGVRASDVDRLQNTIAGVEREVHTNLTYSATGFELDKVLETYEEQLLLARVPLFLMLFLVTGILVYYLALVAGLVVRSRVTEISVLKSRGTTIRQLGLLTLVEGLLLAVPAVALGPFLALGVARVLERSFFHAGGPPVPLAFSPQAFLLGAGGALLAVAVLTISTLVAARQGIVEFRQSGARPGQAPFIHRYYLDLLMLALIGFLWWQVQSRGSFLVRPLGGQGLELDFTLLLGPVLSLVALGLLVMRLFPAAVGVLGRIVEPVGPAWLVQGLRRVARDPILPGSLVVMLMLATALGVMGSTFSATLERSQRDRAQYAAGADLRVQHLGGWVPASSLGLADLVTAQSDGPDSGKATSVAAAAEVLRTSGSLLTRGFSTADVSVLAVDTASFASVAWYRPDFANGQPLADLVRPLAPDESPASPLEDGILLPAEATALSVWAYPGRADTRLSLQARLQDARGYYFDVVFGGLDYRGWRRLEAKLTPVTPPGSAVRDRSLLPAATPPFTVLALQITNRFGSLEPGVVFLDGLSAVGPMGAETPLSPPLAGPESREGGQAARGWQVIEDYYRPGLYALDVSESVVRPGGARSAAFSWAPGGLGLRGLRPGAPEEPIPALVSPDFLTAAEAQVGDVLNVGFSAFALPLQVVGVADYFPTLEPRRGPFAVVDLPTLIHYSNLHNQRTAGGSDELWVRLKEDPSAPGLSRRGVGWGVGGPGPVLEADGGTTDGDAPAAVAAALATRNIPVQATHLAAEMVEERVRQPLVSAGWSGLLVLMFLALVLASASGVMLFSYIDTRERRTEFALLRTLGASKKQINGVVWFNLSLVVVCGVGLGTWAGLQIGTSLLPLLEVAEAGVPVTPPMVLQANWSTLLVSYLVLAAVTVGTVLWLAWFVGKLEVQQVLRIGEA